MFLLFLACSSPQSNASSVQQPSDDELRAWLMPEIGFEIPVGHMPEVPEPPSVAMNFDGSVDAVDRLMYLVVANPIPEVNTAFLDRINKHEIYLVPETRRGNYAAFALEKGEALNLPAELPKDALYPIFSFNSNRIAAIEAPRQALEGMLVVYHESRHVEQWFSATDANEKASFGGVEFERVPPEVCSSIYANELEAYGDMCGYAVAWDMPDFSQCVPSVDPVLFKQAVFLIMKNGQGKNVPECVSTWATQAGHPKPSVYDVP